MIINLVFNKNSNNNLLALLLKIISYSNEMSRIIRIIFIKIRKMVNTLSCGFYG